MKGMDKLAVETTLSNIFLTFSMGSTLKGRAQELSPFEIRSLTFYACHGNIGSAQNVLQRSKFLSIHVSLMKDQIKSAYYYVVHGMPTEDLEQS